MSDQVVDPSELYAQGWALLDDGSLEQALEIGHRLERLQWSGAFELQAAVHEELGQLDKAIDVLERGIDVAGGPYMLFSRLGKYLSDAGRFEEALSAYERGLACDDSDEALFRLNRGLVYSRMNRDEDALREYRCIESDIEKRGSGERIFWHLKACVARVLCDLERVVDISETVEGVASDIHNDDFFEEEKARIAAAYAVSLWRTGEVAASERWLSRAIELDRDTWQAKWLSRAKLAGELEPGGTHYYLTLEGIWPGSMSEDGQDCGFLACFDVIASSEEEALEFVRPFVIEAARDSMAISEIAIVETDRDEVKGIYECHDYIFFDPDGDDEDGGDD